MVIRWDMVGRVGGGHIQRVGQGQETGCWVACMCWVADATSPSLTFLQQPAVVRSYSSTSLQSAEYAPHLAVGHPVLDTVSALHCCWSLESALMVHFLPAAKKLHCFRGAREGASGRGRAEGRDAEC